MIFNEISSFETEYKRFLGMSFGKRILVQGYFFSDFLTSESGETLGVFILNGSCHGTLSEQKDVVKNLYSKGIFKPDRYFFLTAGTYV